MNDRIIAPHPSDERPYRVVLPRGHTYREEHTPDAQEQANRLETLRYKWGHYQGWPRMMQRLGDWGRKWFPFVGSGWNGIGPL